MSGVVCLFLAYALPYVLHGVQDNFIVVLGGGRFPESSKLPSRHVPCLPPFPAHVSGVMLP